MSDKAMQDKARELIATIEQRLPRWRAWFPSEQSSVEVSRDELLALAALAKERLEQIDRERPEIRRLCVVIAGKFDTARRWAEENGKAGFWNFTNTASDLNGLNPAGVGVFALPCASIATVKSARERGFAVVEIDGLITDHAFLPSDCNPAGEGCAYIVAGAGWTTADPIRCRKPEREHAQTVRVRDDQPGKTT